MKARAGLALLFLLGFFLATAPAQPARAAEGPVKRFKQDFSLRSK